MEEQIISFETAKLAKEKGFDLFVNNAYLEDKVLYGTISLMEESDSAFIDVMDGIELENHNHFEFKNRYSAPTQSLLQKWLRENHDIHIEIVYWEDNTWSAQLVGDIFQDEFGDDYEAFGCDTYENALEIGLQEALKLIK
jgi:hypothetical protein